MPAHFQKIKTETKEIPQYLGLHKEAMKPLEESNYIAYQVSGFLPFEFEVIFESNSLREEIQAENENKIPPQLSQSVFDSFLETAQMNFAKKFEDTFKLKLRKFPQTAIMMAQATLSNLIGGIGFFNGQSIVRSQSNKKNVLYWRTNLYTAGIRFI